jgi:uncharacterized protein (UPF0210 family)
MQRNNKRIRIIAFIIGVRIALTPICIVAQSAAKPIVYELGASMTDLLLKQQAYEGSSPAELEGMRQGIEQQLAETPISVTLNSDGTMILLADSTSQSFQYRKVGLKLQAKNSQTGEYIELGFFSKDGSTLTIMQRYILDRDEQPK